MVKINKKEAVREFMYIYGEGLFRQDSTGKGGDKIANREMWNNWTDSLCKDGRITQHQFDTWTYPRNKLLSKVDKALEDGKIKLYQAQEGRIGILDSAGIVWTWFREGNYSEGINVIDYLYVNEVTVYYPEILEKVPVGAIGKLANGNHFEVVGKRLRAHTTQTVLAVKFADGYVNNLTYRVLKEAVIKWGAEQ